MAAVLVALLVAVFTVTGGEIIRGKHYPIRSFPDKINGFSCPYHRPIAALEFGSVGGPVKCLAENEILKHARLVDISERQWVHWAYKHDENYVFENFSWKKSTTPIQHDDSGYVLIEPHSGLLRMIKHHNHGLIFRTSGKDWRNQEDHHTSRSTTPPASSPTWAPTTATPVSSSRSVTISYSSSSSHQSSSRATSKQTTTDRLPTLFSTPLLPTTTSTPKLSTTTSTLITILVTTTVLGTCLGIVTIFKKYQRQRQVMAAAEENNIFLNPLFSEETEV